MTSRPLRLRDADRERLRAGAAALGVELGAPAERRFAAYADLLDVWSERVNLLSSGSAADLVDRHFLDSLAVEPILPDEGAVVDLGSGAGFPGVPLAIADPERRILLVEARRRRANFLRELKRTLSLENVEVMEQRAEQPPATHEHGGAAVVTRAVWSDGRIFDVAARWLQENGELIWTRTGPLDADAEVGPFVRHRTVGYQIGEGRPRTIEVLIRRF